MGDEESAGNSPGREYHPPTTLVDPLKTEKQRVILALLRSDGAPATRTSPHGTIANLMEE